MDNAERLQRCDHAPKPRVIYGKDIKNHRSAICDILGIEKDRLDTLGITLGNRCVENHWYVVFPTMQAKKHRTGDNRVYVDGCEYPVTATQTVFNDIGHIFRCFKDMPKLTEACPELTNIVEEAVSNIIAIHACRFNVHFRPIFAEDLTDEYLDENPMVRECSIYGTFHPVAYIFPSRDTAIANRTKIHTMSDITYGASAEAFCRPFMQLRDKVAEIDLDDGHPAHHEARLVYKKLVYIIAELRHCMLNAKHHDVFNRPINPHIGLYENGYPSQNINAWYVESVTTKLNDCILIADRLDDYNANKMLQRQLLNVHLHVKNVIATMVEMLTEDDREDYYDDDLFDDENATDVNHVFSLSGRAVYTYNPKRDLKDWSRHDLNTLMIMILLFNTEPYLEFNDALMDNLRRAISETELEEG